MMPIMVNDKLPITINAMDLSDLDLLKLDLARKMELTKGEVDHLADGGAQLINSFGRKFVATKLKPEQLQFPLTEEENLTYEKILADKNLQRKAETALARRQHR